MRSFSLKSRYRLYFSLKTLAILGMGVSVYALVLFWSQAFHQTTSDLGTKPIPQSARIQNAQVAFDISLKGGDIVQSELKNDFRAVDVREPRALLHPDESATPPISAYAAQVGVGGPGGLDQKDNRALYTLTQASDERTLRLQAKGENGLLVERVYTLDKEGFSLKLETTLKNQGTQPLSVSPYFQLKHGQSHDNSDGKQSRSFFGFSRYSEAHKYQKYNFKELSELDGQPFKTHDYFTFTQLYYTTAWILNESTSNFDFYSKSLPGNDDNAGVSFLGARTASLTLAPGESQSFSLTLYSGPKRSEFMKTAHEKLGLTVSYGWLWPISKLFLWIMKFFHSLTGNYGIAIMLLTLLVKIVLFPLNHRSYKSMAKMREIMPKMQALRERYADDKAALSRETMSLYRAEKANPLGGCLPMIAQIPVFLALYWMIQESVELRHQPFFFWIHDLSALDPYFILPILMGATMILQQSFTPMPADPAQARLMKLVPYFFTFFFLWFPAGLTIYWVTNNTLTLVQQYLLKRWMSKKPA